MKNLIHLPKKKIDEIFKEADSAGSAMVEIYSVAVPDFRSNVSSIDGWPTINHKTAEYLCSKFIRKFGTQGGFLWMNNGFSTIDGTDIPEWFISIHNCVVYRKELFPVERAVA